MRAIPLTVLLLLFASGTSVFADERADDLARKVVQASGGDVWPRVKILRFTFTVTDANKTVSSARHVWDVKAGTDTVTWEGKTVTVNIWSPPSDEDSKAAFQRWTNDSYWLLAPLKLMDQGVRREYVGEHEGRQVLRISFEKVGLTPGDQYELRIDPETHLIRSWVYMPGPDKRVEATWEEYQKIDGLSLSTLHVLAGGQRTITFDRVDAEIE
jgi:hypothetical protein